MCQSLTCSLIPFSSWKQRFGDWWQQQSEVFSLNPHQTANVVTVRGPQQSSSFSYNTSKVQVNDTRAILGFLLCYSLLINTLKKKIWFWHYLKHFSLNPVVYSHYHGNKWASLENRTGNLDVFILKQEMEDWTLQFGYRCVCVCWTQGAGGKPVSHVQSLTWAESVPVMKKGITYL